ncbi:MULTISPECIES: NAD(P)-dependent oxidoreductase [unclassified Actinotalea]|uniref:NAD(P)-dependent oxidoreductase n=1 Tax=unclassified Actinotalea TaxID=2638618 RepID=UPI0015F56ABF|nr:MULTISPECIES: NAD(P)-dependent oxidoreductase [unclassified Actinotalea]
MTTPTGGATRPAGTAGGARVGVVGLGAMGLPIARVLDGVLAYDPDPGARDRAATAGVALAQDLADLVDRCDVVVLSLPTPDVVADVVAQVAASRRPAPTVLDTSTIDPATARRSDELLRAAGGRYADCPVLGRPEAVGRWTLAVGGDEDVLETARRALAPVAARILLAGPVGAGQTIKLLNNLMLGTINAATAEVLLLAEAAGVDPGMFVDTLLDSGAASVSGLFRDVAPRAVAGDFSPTFSLHLMHKDNGLALRLADSLGVPLAVGPAAQHLNTMALAAGHGHEDSIAVLRVLEEITGRTARRH